MHQKVQIGFDDRVKPGAKKRRHQEFVEVSEQLGRRSWLNCELENLQEKQAWHREERGCPLTNPNFGKPLK